MSKLSLTRKSFTMGFVGCLLGSLSIVGYAQEVVYEIDPSHTYPSFEADHMGGLSVWRGKINSNEGEVVLDKTKKTGHVKVVMHMDSIDFGHDKMNEHAKDAKMFNVAKFPTAVYEGTLVFKGDLPVQVKGDLTLLGVKKPVVLDIQSFKCMTHPFFNKEVCGADARGSFNRADFGLTYGLPMFKPDVKIAIQVEALAKDTAENNPSK